MEKRNKKVGERYFYFFGAFKTENQTGRFSLRKTVLFLVFELSRSRHVARTLVALDLTGFRRAFAISAASVFGCFQGGWLSAAH